MTLEEIEQMEAEWNREVAEYEAKKAFYEARIAVIQAAMDEAIRIFNEPLIAFQRELRAIK